ncbi:MAG: AbrB/MazE/SpoVT family DNA-binding domain-containing protein [Nanoarchaeota archaeon]|nr:AbrB/MazE/SpoVT family DNA-binding domain-containing protein [Nanoarchaeota archaeon]
MRIVRDVGEKGQVVIPKDIRDMLGINNGKKVVFEVRDNEVLLKKEEDTEKFLEDLFSLPKLKKRLTTKELKKILDEEYERVY